MLLVIQVANASHSGYILPYIYIYIYTVSNLHNGFMILQIHAIKI